MLTELRRCARVCWTPARIGCTLGAGGLIMWLGSDGSPLWSAATLRWLLPIGVLHTLWTASRHHAAERNDQTEPWLDQARLAPTRIVLQRFVGANSLGLALVSLGALGAAVHGTATWTLVPLWTTALAMNLWALAAWRHDADPDAATAWRPRAVPLLAAGLVVLIDFADQGHLAQLRHMVVQARPAAPAAIMLPWPQPNPDWRSIMTLTAGGLAIAGFAGAARIAARTRGVPVAVVAGTLILAGASAAIAFGHRPQAGLGTVAAPMLACAFIASSIVAYHCIALAPPRALPPREDPAIATAAASAALAGAAAGAGYADPQWTAAHNLWVATGTLYMVRDIAFGLWLRARWPKQATATWIGLVTGLWGVSLGLQAILGPQSLAPATLALSWDPLGMPPPLTVMVASCACAGFQAAVGVRMLRTAYRRNPEPEWIITPITRPQPRAASGP